MMQIPISQYPFRCSFRSIKYSPYYHRRLSHVSLSLNKRFHFAFTPSTAMIRGRTMTPIVTMIGQQQQHQQKQQMSSFHRYESCRATITPIKLGNMTNNSRHLSSRPPRLPPGSSSKLGTALGASSVVLFFAKSKSILAALKLTKLASLSSMFLTFGTYSIFFGMPYAAGMVSLVLVHESGHALAMRKLGVPFDPMVFIPFVGAAVSMKRSPRDAYDEALIALAGPVMGSAGALVACGAAHATGNQLLFALADFGFTINLFNLMPLGMMDGGRICGSISPYSGLVGLGIGGMLIAEGYIHNPIFYLVMMAGGYETGRRLLWWGATSVNDLPKNYYKISDRQKAGMAAAYFGMVGGLLGAKTFNDEFRKSPERLEFEKRAGTGINGTGMGLENSYQDY